MNNVTTQISSTSTRPLPKPWVEKLFDKMLLDYGKKFVDQWVAADPDKLIAHWAQELADFSREELARGYNALSSRDWPPSLPEFKRMCRPAIDMTVAYYEALEQGQIREKGEAGSWTSPAIYWAWVKVGAFDFKSLSYSQIKARWEKALSEQIDKGEWDSVPEPRIALPEPGKSELSREKATQMIADLNAKGVIKEAEQPTDHRRWAKKIIKRLENGDRFIPAIAEKWAKDELGFSK